MARMEPKRNPKRENEANDRRIQKKKKREIEEMNKKRFNHPQEEKLYQTQNQINKTKISVTHIVRSLYARIKPRVPKTFKLMQDQLILYKDVLIYKRRTKSRT
jgi:hypothetical protein